MSDTPAVAAGRLLRTERSTAVLGEASPLRRLLRSPERERPPAFRERFDDRSLVYDCFWHVDGQRILLCGPPPMNLGAALRAARFQARPSGAALEARIHASLSVMLLELRGAPAGTTAVAFALGDERFVLEVRPNHSAELAGRRVLFSMSRDNELGWIAEWARWHAARHGTDTVVLFDNGSSRYGVGEVEDTLLAVTGVRTVIVPSWPGRFGMTDPALAVNPYWAHFLQIASMSVVLRRFGAAAQGLLNCDVDELAATHSGRPIYALLDEARKGLVVFTGRWMEAVAAGEPPLTHRDFTQTAADPAQGRSGPRKWVLDPRRDWVARLDVHPYWHWVAGRPWFGKTKPRDAFYRHFRGINTNWKEARTASAAAGDLVADTALVADFARIAP